MRLIRIRHQVWLRNIGFEQPCLPIREICQQCLVVCGVHLARPHHLCRVDLGSIVNPLDLW